MRGLPASPTPRCCRSSTTPSGSTGWLAEPGSRPRWGGYVDEVRLPSVPSLPDPRDVVGDLLALGPRLTSLLGDVERIVGEVDRLLTEVDGLLQRIESTRVEAQRVVRRADGTRTRADKLLAAMEPHI